MFENLKKEVKESKDIIAATTIKRIVNRILKNRAPGTRLQRLRINSTKKILL